MPGEFEERLKGVLMEVAASNGRILLFIDDIHNLVPSAGGQVRGNMGQVVVCVHGSAVTLWLVSPPVQQHSMTLLQAWWLNVDQVEKSFVLCRAPRRWDSIVGLGVDSCQQHHVGGPLQKATEERLAIWLEVAHDVSLDVCYFACPTVQAMSAQKVSLKACVAPAPT